MLTGKRAGAGLTAMILAGAGVPLALLAHRARGSTASRRPQLPASALPAGTQTRLIDSNFQARRSEAFATIAIHPVGQPRLRKAPGFPKARVSTTNHLGLESNLPSKDKQVANAEDDVPAHPPPFCIVPTQTSAEPAAAPAAEPAERAQRAEQLSKENKGVEALQEGSGIDIETTMASTNGLNRVELLQEGSGGCTDVETYVKTTNEFNGNGGAFVAPLGGGTSSVDSAKHSEGDAAFFATEDAHTKMEHQQHEHPPDWMKAFERFRPRTSGRKLLGMATASARGGGVVRRLLTTGLEKLHAHVRDTATASVLIGWVSLRFGSKAVLLLTLVAGGVQSAAAANTTTTRSVGTQTNTTSSIGGINSSWTCLPGDADCVSDDTDEATWTWVEIITDILALTSVLRLLWLFAVWLGGTVTTCAMWASTMRTTRWNRRSRGSRRASVSPFIPGDAATAHAAAAAVAVAVAATAVPVMAAPPTAGAASTASTAPVTATPATAATPNTAGTAAPAGGEAAAAEAAALATSSSAEPAPAPVPVLRRARSYLERIVSNLTETAMVVGEAASNVGDAALELVVVVHPTPAAEAEAEVEAVGSVAVSNTSVAATTTVIAASPVMAASQEPAASTASALAAAPSTAVPNTIANDAAAVEGVVAGSSDEPAAAAGVGQPPVLLRSLSYFDRMVSNLTEAVSAVSEAVSNVGDAASNLGNALDMV